MLSSRRLTIRWCVRSVLLRLPSPQSSSLMPSTSIAICTLIRSVNETGIANVKRF